MNRMIVVQRAAHDVNDAGTPTTTWADHLRLRAEMVAQTTGEFLAGGGDREERTAVFRTRWVEGITTADRVLFDGRAHDIADIVETHRRAGLELRCTTKGRAEP